MSRPDSARTRLAAGLCAAALLLLGFPALKGANVTWDAALGDLFFGQRYLSFFTSFDARYLDFAADPYPEGHQPDLSGSPFRSRPWEYYPVANTLGAASSELLWRRLGWLDPFDGFQAVNLGFGLLLVATWLPFLARRLGLAAALAGTLLLLTAPRIAGDLLANPKDFPAMALFTAALAAFAAAWERGSVAGIAGSGALWGLALGTKANALFLPLVVLAAVAWGPRPEAWRGRGRTLVTALAAAALAGGAVLVASWPYLWADPAGRLGEHLAYLLGRHRAMAPGSHAGALTALLWTTPLPFLLAVGLGVLPLARRLRAGDRTARLLALWIGVVLARLHLPGAVNFDGVRHFLELFPPLAAVGGWGSPRRPAGSRRAPRRPGADARSPPPSSRCRSWPRGRRWRRRTRSRPPTGTSWWGGSEAPRLAGCRRRGTTGRRAIARGSPGSARTRRRAARSRCRSPSTRCAWFHPGACGRTSSCCR
ncbi:MAG: glycosyltransferase family 39 protein [Thermoanaerobaculia bacterium]|nr:glycosyltransferase family 39 protein [Thermoanaerobaculia bacterium]